MFNLKVGDLVIHNNRPEIGIGRIADILPAGKITAEFPNYPESGIHTKIPYAIFSGIQANALTPINQSEHVPPEDLKNKISKIKKQRGYIDKNQNQEQIQEIKQKLIALQKRWAKERPNYCHEHKGEIYNFVNDGILDYEAWFNQDLPRIMFLMKETTRNSGWTEISGNPIDTLKYGDSRLQKPLPIWQNVMRWKYAIKEAAAGKLAKNFPALANLPEALNNWHMNDIAWVNIKKSAGETISNQADLRKHAINDRDFLREQIDLIKPSVILCGYTFFCYEEIYETDAYNKKRKDDSCSLIGDGIILHKDRIIFDFYHPRIRNITAEFRYNQLIDMLSSLEVLDLLKT
jgi:hypothetical protein